ncbi:uncharacterized protein KZ484_001419 [Pholidichthys leucotaenia]
MAPPTSPLLELSKSLTALHGDRHCWENGERSSLLLNCCQESCSSGEFSGGLDAFSEELVKKKHDFTRGDNLLVITAATEETHSFRRFMRTAREFNYTVKTKFNMTLDHNS